VKKSGHKRAPKKHDSEIWVTPLRDLPLPSNLAMEITAERGSQLYFATSMDATPPRNGFLFRELQMPFTPAISIQTDACWDPAKRAFLKRKNARFSVVAVPGVLLSQLPVCFNIEKPWAGKLWAAYVGACVRTTSDYIEVTEREDRTTSPAFRRYFGGHDQILEVHTGTAFSIPSPQKFYIGILLLWAFWMKKQIPWKDCAKHLVDLGLSANPMPENHLVIYCGRAGAAMENLLPLPGKNAGLELPQGRKRGRISTRGRSPL